MIGYRELAYAPAPDGQPLDPDLSLLAAARNFPPFDREPYDLPTALPDFRWPATVISGARDLRTPRPLAERVVDLLPDGVLVPLDDLGHSALDTHQLAALNVARIVSRGHHRRLPDLAARVGALPRRGMSRLVGTMIRARVAAEGLLPRSGRKGSARSARLANALRTGSRGRG